MLDGAIRKAEAAGIVVLASTSDQGLTEVSAWPALYGSVLAVSSADASGNLIRDHIKLKGNKGPHYSFQGEEITIGGTLITGSSVATAIAAGIASLLVSCYKMTQIDSKIPLANGRKNMVMNCFDSMMERIGETNYCAPWKFFPEKSNNWNFGGPREVLKWMTDKFPADSESDKHMGLDILLTIG